LLTGSSNLFPEDCFRLTLSKESEMANKEQKSNANTKKEPKSSLKEKRLAKQEKKAKKD
jgi:hypothetical protein